MNLGILNTVIAMVIVLLVLSLIVQSVQTLVKKLLKLKSRQIKGSLVDLFEQAIERSDTPTPSFLTKWITAVRNRFRRTAVVLEKSPAEKFTEDILNEFKKIGRVSVFGRPVLDSLSKGDLRKVMGKLELERLFPADYVAKFDDLRKSVLGVGEALDSLSKNQNVRGAVSTNLAELRSVLGPIFNDLQSMGTGQPQSKTLLADLLRLKKLDVHQLLDVLGQAQQALAEQRLAAATAGNTAEVASVDEIAKLLTSVATTIGGLAQKFDAAILPLRMKLEQVEIWFDTVTQSFDERYTRHMKTVSIIISAVLVILLNANFFRVYKSISTNEVQRDLIAQSGPEVLKIAREARGVETPSPSPSPNPAPSPSPSPSPNPARGASTGTNSGGTTTSTATPSPTPTPVDASKEIAETRKDIAVLTDMYEGFGFTPLNWKQALWYFQGLRGWTPCRNAKGDVLDTVDKKNEPYCKTDAEIKQAESKKDSQPTGTQPSSTQTNTNQTNSNQGNTNQTNSSGNQTSGKQTNSNEPNADQTNTNIVKCDPCWREQSDEEYHASRRADLFTLFGWAIMAMLLSVGAPFWQDTLESLFGIKNLLRQKSGTQNIETQSGAGQPKQA